MKQERYNLTPNPPKKILRHNYRTINRSGQAGYRYFQVGDVVLSTYQYSGWEAELLNGFRDCLVDERALMDEQWLGVIIELGLNTLIRVEWFTYEGPFGPCHWVETKELDLYCQLRSYWE